MASPNVNVQEDWKPEPELMERPPRRIVESDASDLNKPNTLMLFGVAGGALVLGVFLLIFGLASTPTNALVAGLGGVFVLAGGALAAFVPQMVSKHRERGERLAMHGLPVMARVLSSDNMAGDNRFVRLVKYQVTLPGGELVHRQVQADDRLLPKRIPGNATALVDMDTSDVELYCALPFRVISKEAPSARPATPDPLEGMPVAKEPQVAAGHMNTINVDPPVRPVRTNRAGVRPEPEPEPVPQPAAVEVEPEPAATETAGPALPSLGPVSLPPRAKVERAEPEHTEPVQPEPVAEYVPAEEAKPTEPEFDPSDELAKLLNSPTPPTPETANSNALPRLDSLTIPPPTAAPEPEPEPDATVEVEPEPEEKPAPEPQKAAAEEPAAKPKSSSGLPWE
ncbi:MAG: hypothetical protein OHK0029_15580 [Armatimonadaceae bacterium]